MSESECWVVKNITFVLVVRWCGCIREMSFGTQWEKEKCMPRFISLKIKKIIVYVVCAVTVHDLCKNASKMQKVKLKENKSTVGYIPHA